MEVFDEVLDKLLLVRIDDLAQHSSLIFTNPPAFMLGSRYWCIDLELGTTGPISLILLYLACFLIVTDQTHLFPAVIYMIVGLWIDNVIAGL